MAHVCQRKTNSTLFGDKNMHANDIAFGIEIETHMPGNDATPIGG